jgi:hypothetical protein
MFREIKSGIENPVQIRYLIIGGGVAMKRNAEIKLFEQRNPGEGLSIYFLVSLLLVILYLFSSIL